MTKRLKISACAANYSRADLFKVIDRLAELGFDGAELTVMYHVVPKETSPGKRAEIRRHAADAGLKISALHFIFEPGMKMASDDAAERQHIVDHMVEVMQLASDLGAPTVVIGGGGARSIPAEMDWQVGLDRVLAIYRDMAKRCEDLGVFAGFEALNRYETNLGFTLEECCGYAERIGSPIMKVVGDTFHMNIEEASLLSAIRNAGNRLAHLHLPDSHRLAPGGGHIDFPPLLEALSEIGFDGFVSFEFFSISPQIWYLPTFEACDAEVAKAIRFVRDLEVKGL
jgi:sugar phosphate isomerase/epimerase